MSERLNWMSARAADGPKVAAWMESHLSIKANTSEARRLIDWKRGGRADFYAIDRIMVAHGWHVSDLPDDVWVPGGARTQRLWEPKPRRKPAKIEQKPCANCGEPIPLAPPNGRRHSPAEYERRKFCTEACRQEGVSLREVMRRAA